jgi:hypothetical protein
MNTTVSSNLIYDTDLNGGVDSNGQINQLWGSDALSNSIIMWLISFKGDIIHDPNRGGYFTYWLFKPMLLKNVDAMKMSIRNGIDQDFTPKLTLNKLDIIPNFAKRYWNVYMEVYAASLQIGSTVDVNIKNKV